MLIFHKLVLLVLKMQGNNVSFQDSYIIYKNNMTS